MTENTGWPLAEPGESQAVVAEPEPQPEPSPEPVPAEAAPEPTVPDAAGLTGPSASSSEAEGYVLTVTNSTSWEAAPDPVPPPFIPSEGVAPWLREILLGLHQRLRNAGY